MTPEPGEPIVTSPSTDIGSERLATALAAMDVAAIGRALRNDYVIVPLTRGPEGETQTRVVAADDPDGDRRWELCVFSSTQAFSDFLAGDPQREFAIQHGSGLVPLIEAYRSLLRRVVFDPAGPHPVQASVDDVLAALQPDASDDPVAWIAGEEPERGLRPGERVVGLDLALPDDWATIDLTDQRRLSKEVGALVARQLRDIPQAPVLRGQLTAWLTSAARTAAAAGGRQMAYLVRRTETAAAALTVTVYWQDVGEPTGAAHLDDLTERLRGGLGGEDELARAEAASGPFVRHTHRVQGAPEVGGQDTPLLVLDYWLAFPDGRGLCLVSFATPHIDAADAIRLLADNVVLAALWEVEPPVDSSGLGAAPIE